MLIVFEAVQDGVHILGRAAQVGQVAVERVARRELIQHQAVHQPVDHAGVAGEDTAQIRAGGAEPDVEFQRGGVEAEQLPEHAFAAQRGANLVEVHQRGVGVGRGGDRLQQLRRDRCQEVPTSPRGEKADLLLGQGHQVVVGLLEVAERILAEHLLDSLLGRIGIEHKVHLGLDVGVGVGAEGVVQEVVQDTAIHGRAGAVVFLESGQGGPLGRVGVAHAQSQLAKLVRLLGQQVGLQVEHDLQPVLDLSQEAVVFGQEQSLLVGQAADLFELGDGLQRVRGPQLGQVGAVEKLEELDHELDVPNAAVAGLDVSGVGLLVVRLFLDASLQRLDPGDVGPVQVAAVDPGAQPVEERAAQLEIAGGGSGFDKGLTLPRASAEIVVVQCALKTAHHGAAPAVGAQAQVHAIGRAQARRLGQEAHKLACQAVVELATGHMALDGARVVLVVEEHQVDVAGVVQLDAAELSQREHDKAGRPAVGVARNVPLAGQVSPGRFEGRFEDGVGQVRDLRGDGPQRLLADDVAVRDSQRLASLEAS